MRIEVIECPPGLLGEKERTHLKVAQAIAGEIPITPSFFKTSIPAVCGAYDSWRERIFIHPSRLKRLSTTVDTVIHELSHHEIKGDHGPRFAEAEKRIARRLAKEVAEGKFDNLLSNAIW